MTMSRKDRNQFIIDEFEEGASINEIAKNPNVNIKYAAVRRVIINSMGYEKYKAILRGEAKYASAVLRGETQVAEPVVEKPQAKPKKTFLEWLFGK